MIQRLVNYIDRSSTSHLPEVQQMIFVFEGSHNQLERTPVEKDDLSDVNSDY